MYDVERIHPPPRHSDMSSLQGCRILLLALFGVALSAWGGIPGPAAVTLQGAIDPSLPPLERSRALAALSARLVEQAQSGQAHASAYRIDVAHYRESLRDLAREDGAHPEPTRLPRVLLLDMVRMAALLQSAAQCQTGRYIVCPPDLMARLYRQQALEEQDLAALHAGR